MTIWVTDREPAAKAVDVNDEYLTVLLDDGRKVSNPLPWYPRLLRGTPAERKNYELLGDGEVIRWPDLDEDLSAESILAGRRSGENEQSLARWLSTREGNSSIKSL